MDPRPIRGARRIPDHGRYVLSQLSRRSSDGPARGIRSRCCGLWGRGAVWPGGSWRVWGVRMGRIPDVLVDVVSEHGASFIY
jgi:hypothetical protein